MNPWTLVSMFFTFIRELIFDSKAEYDYTSTSFNAKKALLFGFVMLLSTLTIFFGYRAFKQASYIVALKEAVIANDIRDRHQYNELKRKHKELLDAIDKQSPSVKKSILAPSDSGNTDVIALPPVTVTSSKESKKYIENFIKRKGFTDEHAENLSPEEKKKLLDSEQSK